MSEEEHKRLIEEKLGKKEAELMKGLALIRQTVYDLLIDEKGYTRSDIEFDKEFCLELDGKTYLTAVDYIISLDNRRLIAVKCSPGSLESRERHLIAFARVVDSCRIPYAVLTDGIYARMLDTLTGRLISEGPDSLPDRDNALGLLKKAEFMPYPPDRFEKEKRILLAFEVIKCTEELLE